MVAQTLHSFKAGDTTVAIRTGEQYDWQHDGGMVPTVELAESRNGGESYTCKAVIPLAEAVEFAKQILALAQQAEEDAWIDRMYQDELDRQFVVQCAVEHGSGYSSGVYAPSLQ